MLDFIHRGKDLLNTVRKRPVQAGTGAAACIGVLILGIAMFTPHKQLLPAVASAAPIPAVASMPEPESVPAPHIEADAAAPAITTLSSADATRYHYIFALQHSGDWQQADILAGDLEDRVLMGHVLAERYLSKDYTPTYSELHAWLTAYADHPQAFDIYKLAVARRTGEDERLNEISHKPILAGYGADNGLAGTGQDPRLTAGLDAWQAGNFAEAAHHFTAMADAASDQSTRLSQWEASAAAFWAYRALNKAGRAAEGAQYLKQAAAHPRTFYGVLARRIRGEQLGINPGALPVLTAEDMQDLYGNPGIRRAVALVQAHEDAAAESELRTAFPQSEKNTRVKLLALARALNLPAAQMSMASVLKANGMEFDAALYPTPGWAPPAGFAVDPALVFAFARQESGFRASAHSRDGGMGLMQLMPHTARSMRELTPTDIASSENIFEPSANLALGQSYISYLMQNQPVGGNLIYLTAAYNAGPAKVAEWQKNVQSNGDPLLFLERIPFGLTRNYVTQVLASYWIYQEIDGRRGHSAMALARGQWPKYDAEDAPLTATASAAADHG